MNEDQQGALILWITGSARVQAALGDEFAQIFYDLKLGSERDDAPVRP